MCRFVLGQHWRVILMNSGCGSYHIFVHFLSLVLLFSLSLSLSPSLTHTHTHTYGLEVFLIFSALDSSSVENKHKYTSVLGQIDDLVETTAVMQSTPQ